MTSIVTQALQELGLVGDFPDYPQGSIDQVSAYANDATEVTKFEGGKFSLCKKDSYYFLKKGESLVGWTELTDVTYNHQQYYSLKIVYILPQYRQTKATLLLVYGVKQLLTRPVIVDGALFAKGNELLTGLYHRERFKISTVDKKTGEQTPYHPTDITDDMDKNFVIVEAHSTGFFMEHSLPGGKPYHLYFSLFEHLHDIEI